MSFKFIVPAAVLLCAVSAHAQAGPTSVKSAEDITCELTGDCEKADSSLVTKDAGESRGFSIRRQASGGSAVQAAPRPGNVIAPSVGRAPANRPVAATTHYVARPAVAAVRPGHSNLSVGFVLGSAELDASGKAQAARLLEALRGPKLAGKKIEVAGHTDSMGSREYNFDLSRRRADALVEYLAQNGVERSRLDAKGYGFDRPLANTSPKAAANRRVEISVVN
jgi:outer membrane protein OmpA-like peptidoglycan-associated protein